MSQERKASFMTSFSRHTGAHKGERGEAHVADVGRNSLFDMVDTDASGAIDKEEFAKLYDEIKKETMMELARQHELEVKTMATKRRLKLTACLGAIMAVALAISVAANFAVTQVLLEVWTLQGKLTLRTD